MCVKTTVFTNVDNSLYFSEAHRTSQIYESHERSNGVGFEIVKKGTISWDMAPCSPVKMHRLLEETPCLHLQVLRYAKEAKVKKLEHLQAARSFEISVSFYKTERFYSPEDSTRQPCLFIIKPKFHKLSRDLC